METGNFPDYRMDTEQIPTAEMLNKIPDNLRFT